MTCHTLLILPGILLCAVIGCATTGERDSSPKGPMAVAVSRDHVIMQKERAVIEAAQRNDAAALEALLGEEFRETFLDLPEYKRGLPRENWMQRTLRNPYHDVRLEHAHVTTVGDTYAIASMRMIASDRLAGASPPEIRTGTWEMVDTWVFRDGRWMLSNRMSHPVTFEFSKPQPQR